MRCVVILALALGLVGCVQRAGTLATGPEVATQAASGHAEQPAGNSAQAPLSGQQDAGVTPFPIQVTLEEPGYVTLVIEDRAGRRIRNLVSETRLPAGRSVLYWDGLDDLDRDANAAAHAVYHIPGKLVPPDEYRVRGLYRKDIDLFYEFTVYNPGNPPWPTRDRSSEWLTNHTPPSAVCFVPAGAAPARGGYSRIADPSPPQVLIGSFVAEGGSGLAWVSLTGIKLHGQMWLGGVWTGAAYLTRDAGDHPVPGVYAYTGTAWEGDGYNKNQPELRLHSLVNASRKLEAPRDTRFGVGEDLPVLKPTYKFPDKKLAALGGMAARNGLLVVSLPKMNQLLFMDAAGVGAALVAAPGGHEGRPYGTAPLEDARGLAFERNGHLLVLSGRRLLRITLPARDQIGQSVTLPDPQVVVASGLEDPQAIALDGEGNIYVSDRGASHQVKVFAPDGRFLRAIGTPGAPHAGPYDPNHMNNPKGITITSDGHLWVAEEDFQPKRVSVWTLDGRLVMAFYGPPIYGGGGVLDPEDKSLFYLGGMTFRLDWRAGTGQPIFIHHRPGPKDLQIPGDWGGGTPETPIYTRGRKYWTNVFTTHPTNGASTAYLWQDRGGLAVPVAALGRAGSWPALKTDAIEARLPKGVDPKKADWSKLLFAWSDLNGDAQIQPEEVAFARGSAGSGVTVSPDLTMVTGHAVAFAPQRFTPQGAPVYDLTKGETLVPDPQQPTSSGGGQVLACRDGWTVLTVAPKPFAPQSMGGSRGGKALWSYPSAWPGLHASHIAPMPEVPGELIGTTRLLGPALCTRTPRRGEAGELWAINGNKGNVYLFTTDGLFVATLFRDSRIPEAAWSSKPKAVRGMRLSDVTNMEESFWPSITETRDGKVYLVTNWPSLIRVEGLETIRRLRPTTLTVTPDLLAAAQAQFLRSEARRQEKAKADETLAVAIRQAPPVVDGKLEDWAGAHWVTVDVRAKQRGDWGRSEQKTQAAVAVAGDRLYAAFKTGETNLLANSGASMQNLFKTGGALDLMIGTDPKADPKRNRAVAGDLRLLVALVKGKPVAVLYRPVAQGVAGEPVQFSSPLRTLAFDRVDEVSQQIAFAQGEEGVFELSIPLAVLGLAPQPGLVLRGDIGVLRGDGDRTVQRAYWHNKATGLTSDIPTEAELTPQLWGRWEFKAGP